MKKLFRRHRSFGHMRRIFRHYPTPPVQHGEAPLNFLRPGEKGVIIKVAGGRGMLKRMASLGFVPGAEIVILHNFGFGPITVRVHDAHIALGRGVAVRIYVQRDQK